MNKTIYFLFVIYLFIQGCHNDDINDIYKDYRFKTKVTLNEGNDPDNLYLNGTLPMKISIEKNDAGIGDYHFSYIPQQGKGMLWYNDSLLTPGLPVTISEEKEISLKYIPTTTGSHSITFSFKNENLNVTDRFNGKVGRQFFQLKTSNLPPKILVDNPSVFNLELIAPEEEYGKFKTNVHFSDGAGQVYILKTQDTITDKPSDYLTKGYNKISLTSTKQGLNNLRFTVSNHYALSQTIDIPLNVEYPDYSVQAICDTSVMAGKNNFVIRVENTDRHPENHYWITYRPLINSGTLSINKNPLESGNLLEIKIGDNICEFTAQNLGATQLEFIVRDKYSTIKRDTVSFNVTESSADIQITNFKEEYTVYDVATFNLAVNTSNYTGQYKIEILQEPANCELFINGVSYTGGRIPLVNKDNTLIGFIPKATGNIKMSAIIYDEYNSRSVKELNFKVINSQGQINISNQNPSINILDQTSFNFSINKPQYKDDFQFEITTTPVNAGALKINGKEYSGGKIKIDNPNNTLVTFVPEKIGNIILHLTAYDKFGGRLNEDITYSVSNTTIQVGVTNLEKELIVGKETSFNITAHKPFLKPEQNLQFSINADPSSKGVIYINNQYYLPNSVISIKNQENVIISYLPNEEGKVTLFLNVWDDYLGTINYPVTFNITNPPIKIQTTNYSENICINTESKLNFSVSKNNYKGKFKVNIIPSSETPLNLKLNGIQYEGGYTGLEFPENNQISFIPDATGTLDLKIQITDETKAKTEKTIHFNVTNPDLQLHLINIENDLSIFEKSSFSFAVTKPNYNGKFYFELFAKNCKDIKIGNVSYPVGEKQILNTPSGSTISFVPTEIGTDTVKMKLKIYDEWGSMTEKQISFSVNNSSINFHITNFESQLALGRTSTFTVKANKPNYHGNLDFEIIQIPEQGQFSVNGKGYLSGKREFNVDTPLDITYTPEREGKVNLNIIVSDRFGEKKSAILEYNISNPGLHLDVSDFISTATFNVANHFYASANKMYYEDAFFYSLTTEPANAGILKFNDTLYTGGRIIHNSEPIKISFIPSVTGNVIVHLQVSDKTGLSETRDLRYFVATYPQEVVISNQETSLTLNKPTSFNFSAFKKEYHGKFLFEIMQEPANAGTIKVDNSIYQGGKTEVKNIHNTFVHFTPAITGDVRLLLKVYNEQEETTTKEIKYSVSNSSFEIIGSNQERDIILGKPTNFNIAVIKQNYSGSYQFEIEQNPVNSGTLIVDGIPYSGGKQKLNNPAASSIQYISAQPGLNNLTFTVYDEFGANARKTFDFNVENPIINLTVTNKADNLIFKTPTKFNITIDKQYYSDKFEYQIEQVPAESGTIMIDAAPYEGGRKEVANPNNLQIGFTPLKEGSASLLFSVWDKVSGKAQETLNFSVKNPEIEVAVSSYSSDIIVDAPSLVNFSVTKQSYDGQFTAKLSMYPAEMGSIKLNGNTYTGEKVVLKDLNNNLIEFTAQKVGAVSLKLEIEDTWGKTCTKLLNYSISNSDLKISTTDKEYELLLNKLTSLTFSIDKPNYTGTFEAQIVAEPENAGELRLNSSSYRQGWVAVNPSDNLLEFVPKTTGAVLLKLKIKDNLGGEKEIPLNYNIANTPILINVTNKEEKILINNKSSFNVTVAKEYYNQGFDLQIEQIPANSGTLFVNGKRYLGGVQGITDPQNLQIGFIPSKEGNLSLLLNVTDKVSGKAQTTLNFTVENPPVNVELSSYTPDIIVHSPSSVNFSVSKKSYKGQFSTKLYLQPADMGTIKLNGNTYNGEKYVLLDPNNNLIEFTANRIGAATIRLEVSDTCGITTTKLLNYSIGNSDMRITTSGKEYELLLNKATTLSFDIDKPNYSGLFNAQIITDPEKAGDIKINFDSYQTGWTAIKPNGNLIEFTPHIVGAALLKLQVKDELGSEKEIALNYNVNNPPINIVVSNYTNNISLNNPTSLNLALSKENYTDNFSVEISTIPAASGMLQINDQPYTGGYADVTVPENTLVKFTPNAEGTIVLQINVKDNTGMVSTKNIEFNVQNPPISLDIFNSINQINTGQTIRFNIKASKKNYTGNFNYEITPYPYSSCNITVDGKAELSGSLSSEPAEISFTPTTAGAIALKIKIDDFWGGSVEKQIDFSVSNAPLEISVSKLEENIIINKETGFNLAVNKRNYPDDKMIYYSIFPSQNVTINNQNYTGGILQSKYSEMKIGVPVKLTPNHAGVCEYTIHISDEFDARSEKTIKYNVANPEMRLFLTGINESEINPVNFNETFKFTVNVDKEFYTDDFAYWITSTPSDAALITTEDITPRSRNVNGNGTITGTISNGTGYGISTMEVRLTPNNLSYLDSDIKLEIRVRDKWNNEKKKEVVFHVTTSTISIDVVRNTTSIPVLKPYLFHYIISKPDYSGKFKYIINGMADNDLIEVSGDGTNFYTYLGGKYEVPNVDHTYIRYTPHKVGAIPLKLYVYDDNDLYTEKDMSFDIQAPAVKISGGGVKNGFTEEFIPFSLVATEENGNKMNMEFDVDENLNGIVLFNTENIYNSNSRASHSIPVIPVESGKNNKLEMMSRLPGAFSTQIKLKNEFNSNANANTTIKVTEQTFYHLNISQTGEGQVTASPASSKYKSGETVSLTATASAGWKFVRWEGDLSGSNTYQSIIMNSDKTIKAVFEKNASDIAIFNLVLSVNTQTKIKASCEIKITEKESGNLIYTLKANEEIKTQQALIRIDRNKTYTITYHFDAEEYINKEQNIWWHFKDASYETTYGSGEKDAYKGTSRFYKNVTVSGASLIGNDSYNLNTFNTFVNFSSGTIE